MPVYHGRRRGRPPDNSKGLETPPPSPTGFPAGTEATTPDTAEPVTDRCGLYLPNGRAYLTAGRLAVALAEAGFSVIPLLPRSKRPATDYLPGGVWEPLRQHALRPRMVEAIVHEAPILNWGLILGERWGLCVLDVDDPAAYLVDGSYPVPLTPVVSTARGWHVWLRHPGHGFTYRKLPFGELLGAGYALLPGSVHPDGLIYTWAADGLSWPELQPAPSPCWVFELLEVPVPENPCCDDGSGICARTIYVSRATSPTKPDFTWPSGSSSPTTGSPLAPASKGTQPRRAEPVENLPEASSGADWRVLERSEAVARALVEWAGREWRGLGKAFKCVLPGHEERRASAAIWRTSSGELRYRDFHSRDGRGAYHLADVFASLVTGELRVLGPGELPLWTVRMLVDLGFVEEPDAGLVDVPQDAPKGVVQAWAAIRRLVALRRLYMPDRWATFPVSHRFLASWAGIPQATAAYAIGWLMKRGYLQTLAQEGREGRTTSKLRLFVPGPRAVRAREAVERLLAGVMELGNVLVTNQSSDRGESHADGPGPVHRG